MPWLILPGGNCPLLPVIPPAGTAPPTSSPAAQVTEYPQFAFVTPVDPQGNPVPPQDAAKGILGILGQTQTVSVGPSSPSGPQSSPSGAPSSQSATSGAPSSQSGAPSGTPSSQSATAEAPTSQNGAPSGVPSSQSGAPSGQSGELSSKRVPLGELVSVNVELVGLEGQPVMLSWSIFQEGGQTNLFGNWLSGHIVAFRLEATTNDDTATLEMWIPLPKLPGPFFIQLSLATDNAGLASAASGPFD